MRQFPRMLPNATAWPLVLAFAYALPFLTGKGFDAFARSYTFFEPPLQAGAIYNKPAPHFCKCGAGPFSAPEIPGAENAL